MFEFPCEHLAPVAPMTVTEWAERNIILDPTSPEPGRYKVSRTPFAEEIQNCFTDRTTRQISMMACTQLLKTRTMQNMIGFCCDFSPSNVLVILPTSDKAREWGDERIKKMLRTTPALARHLTGKEDDIAGTKYQLKQNYIRFAGANSPNDLSSDSMKVVIADEVDKFPAFSGTETDPVKLGMERTQGYGDRKIIIASSPTTMRKCITREYLKSDMCRWFVPCVHCGVFQPLRFGPTDYPSLWGDDDPAKGRVVWPKDSTPEEIRVFKLATYECGYCYGTISENEKGWMVSRGLWVPRGAKVNLNGEFKKPEIPPSHRGFQISALYAPWEPRSWSHIAADFIEAKDDVLSLEHFVNNTLGEPMRQKIKVTKEDHIRALRTKYKQTEVPPAAIVLTAGVDVQVDGFFWVVRAWSYRMENWLVAHGFSETPEDLVEQVVRKVYRKPAGEGLQVALACIDSGFDTATIYDICRNVGRAVRPNALVPIKGRDSLPAREYSKVIIDTYPNGKPLPGGISLYLLDTNKIKDQLNKYTHAGPGDWGQSHLPQDVTEEYVAHMVAEQKFFEKDKRTGKTTESWKLVGSGKPNHYWDCECYAFAAAKILMVDRLEKDQAPEQPAQPREERESWVTSGSGSWIPRGNGSWVGGGR